MIGRTGVLACALATAAASTGCEPRAATDAAPAAHPPLAAAGSIARPAAAPGEPRFAPLRPMTTDVEVLHGDPEQAGQPFVMRIRELPGTRIPLHSHPVDEHLTVVQGTFRFAIGERWDPAALQDLGPGAYVFIPKGRTMYGESPDGAVVQVHGIGPFAIHWRDGLRTLDSPDADRAFRYRKGTKVRTPRGDGTIRAGYASGALVQYEIEGDDGRRFISDEADLRSP